MNWYNRVSMRVAQQSSKGVRTVQGCGKVTSLPLLPISLHQEPPMKPTSTILLLSVLSLTPMTTALAEFQAGAAVIDVTPT